MSPKGYIRILFVLAAVFRLAGNEPELADDRQLSVSVRVGDQAVLPCNVSAFMGGQTSEDGPFIRWLTNAGPVCDFSESKSYPADGYSNRTEITRLREHQYALVINHTKPSDAGDYYCYLQKQGENAGRDVAGFKLTVLGHKSNVSVVYGEALAIDLIMTGHVSVELTPASGSPRVRVCEVQGSRLTAGLAYELRAKLGNNTLQLANVSYVDEGSYSVIDNGTGTTFNTVVLTVEGRTENRTLVEGEDLSVSLCLLVSPYVEFSGGSESPAVCLVEGGQVTCPEGERLAVQNGTLILHNLTAKDQGKYVVKTHRDGRVVLTLIVTKIPHDATRVPWYIWLIVAVVSVLVLVGISCFVLYCRRRMKRKQKEEVEQFELTSPLKDTPGGEGKSAIAGLLITSLLIFSLLASLSLRNRKQRVHFNQ